jgi:hypothetical protein
MRRREQPFYQIGVLRKEQPDQPLSNVQVRTRETQNRNLVPPQDRIYSKAQRESLSQRLPKTKLQHSEEFTRLGSHIYNTIKNTGRDSLIGIARKVNLHCNQIFIVELYLRVVSDKSARPRVRPISFAKCRCTLLSSRHHYTDHLSTLHLTDLGRT